MKLTCDPNRAKSLISAFQSVSERVSNAAGTKNVRLHDPSSATRARHPPALHAPGDLDMTTPSPLPRAMRIHGAHHDRDANAKPGQVGGGLEAQARDGYLGAA